MDKKLKRKTLELQSDLYKQFPERDQKKFRDEIDTVMKGTAFTGGIQQNLYESLVRLENAEKRIGKNISSANTTLNAMAKIQLYDDLKDGIDLSLSIKELCPEKDINKEKAGDNVPEHDVKMSLSVEAVNKLLYQRWKNGDLDFCQVEGVLKTCQSLGIIESGKQCKFEEAPRIVFKQPGKHVLKFPEMDCDIEGNIPGLFNSEKVEGEIEVLPEILEDGNIQFKTKTNFELGTNFSRFYNPIATVSSLMKNGLIFPAADLFGVGFEDKINSTIDSEVKEKSRFNLPKMKFKHHRATENAFILYADFKEEEESQLLLD